MQPQMAPQCYLHMFVFVSNSFSSSILCSITCLRYCSTLSLQTNSRSSGPLLLLPPSFLLVGDALRCQAMYMEDNPPNLQSSGSLLLPLPSFLLMGELVFHHTPSKDRYCTSKYLVKNCSSDGVWWNNRVND